MRRFIQEWPARHQHPVSRVLHAIGIPMTVAAVPLMRWQLIEWNWPAWWRPVLLFVVGYVLQYVGHLIEGNDMGEIIGIKKWLGKPYVDISPRYQK